MKRLWLVFVLLGVTLLSWSQSVPAPSVYIDSDPMGARILLDGKLLPERTPVLLRGLAAGPHRVSVWREGFLRADRDFVVAEGSVPLLEVTLAPDSAVLAFPANASVSRADGSLSTEGKQFRYPAGTYELLDAGLDLQLNPVFPDEGLLVAAGWGLLALSGAAVLSTASDAYHISTRWMDHPSLVTVGLWVSALFELPWYGSLLSRKARFVRDAAPTLTPLPERLDQAKSLFEEADEALQSGELDRAEPLLARVVRDYPDSRLVPAAWFRLARIHSVTGRRDLALGEYRLVAETYPQAAYHDRARKALADLYEAAGDPEKAVANLDRMVLADGFFDPADIAEQKQRLTTTEVADAP